MNFVLLLFALSSLAEDSRPSRALASQSRLLVLSSPDDEGIETTRAAVAFWEEVFSELQLEGPLGSIAVDTSSPRRHFENYARLLSQQAGRSRTGPGPPAPRALLELDAEVVVLLSSQKVMPFAWPLREPGPRFFVALPAGVDLEIVKHELGHALGLRHREGSGLMCLPCDARSTRELDDAERTELRRLYRSADP